MFLFFIDSYHDGISHVQDAADHTDIKSDKEQLGRNKRNINKLAKAIYNMPSYSSTVASIGHRSDVEEKCNDQDSEGDCKDSDVDSEQCEATSGGQCSLPNPPAFLQEQENFRYKYSQSQQGTN